MAAGPSSDLAAASDPEAGMDAVQKAEWEQRRIVIEKQGEEARRLKRERKAAAEVERRTQVWATQTAESMS